MFRLFVETWSEGSDPELWDAMVKLYDITSETVDVELYIKDTKTFTHIRFDGEYFYTDHGRFSKSMVGY